MDAPISAAAAATVDRSVSAFRSDELTLTLQPGEGAEIKATMNGGETYVFSWVATGGAVDFDMHGQRLDGGGEEASYWKDEAVRNGHGTFRAPFAGKHGWFWQNTTWEPVTIVLKTSGFYSTIERVPN